VAKLDKKFYNFTLKIMSCVGMVNKDIVRESNIGSNENELLLL